MHDNNKTCDKKICCNVQNCVYHSGETTCTAKTVDVGPHSACCCQDTSCATFKPQT